MVLGISVSGRFKCDSKINWTCNRVSCNRKGESIISRTHHQGLDEVHTDSNVDPPQRGTSVIKTIANNW